MDDKYSSSILRYNTRYKFNGEVFDDDTGLYQSGKLDITSYDFKGNMLSSSRRLCTDYSGIINWNTYTDPTGESFVTAFTFDAMNRPVTETTPDDKVRTYEYNKAGLLERVLLYEVEYVSNIEYNVKGQRSEIYFGNGSKTRYYYDLQNFRLTRLVTSRDNGSVILQDLNYTYDPEGNIVQQNDNAQQANYFKNAVVAPVGKYEYDTLYRIIKAEGRELTNLSMATDADFENSIGIVNEGFDVMQNYTQLYSYDELGNIGHVESQGRWNRIYTYDTSTNRLLNTGLGYNYTYDAHGNMVSMPHLGNMEWDYKGNLSKTIRTGNGYTAYYRYDSQGNRVRKIYIHDNIIDERIYIGNYELYRKKVGGTLNTERVTTFVSDDKKRIAIVDTRNVPTPVEVTIRYQYDNHLGSACLELDGSAQVISYEEYHPFGTTSYRAGRNATETSLKRYKYVGKERDEDTGLYYYGARYYAAWLCRFVSVDPIQFKYPELTPFQYASNRPITGIDLDGLEFYANSDGIITGQGKDKNCRNVYFVDKYDDKGTPKSYYDLNVTIEEYAGFASLVWNESSGNKEESYGIANAVANYVNAGGSNRIKTVQDIVVKANYYSSAVLQKDANEYANTTTNRYELESVLNALMRINYPNNDRFKDNTNGATHWDGVDLVVGLKKDGDCANQGHRNYIWTSDSKDLLKKFYNSFSVSEKKLNKNDVAFNTSVYVWNWKYGTKDAHIKAIKIFGKTLFEKILGKPGEGYNQDYPTKIDYNEVVSKKILNHEK